MAAKFEILKTKGGEFYFNLKAANGKVVLTGETYKTRASAQNGIKSVQTNSAHDGRFERKTSKKGEPYFVLKASNGEPIGRSEMYSSASAMEKGIKSVQASAKSARIEDTTTEK